MNTSGGLLSHNRYMPFGEVRDNIPTSPITQTDFGYTGQRNMGGMGLMDYRARFYSPLLGRFIQPDSIVPNPSNPQSLNRYAYVINNPINFNDPSGHFCVSSGLSNDDFCSDDDDMSFIEPWKTPLVSFFTEEGGDWKKGEKQAIIDASWDVANAFARDWNNPIYDNANFIAMTGDDINDFLVSPQEVWYLVYGGQVKFSKSGRSPGHAGRTRSKDEIVIYDVSDTYISEHPRVIVHELGHAFDNALCSATLGCVGPGGNPGRNSLKNSLITNYGDSNNGYNGYAGGRERWQFRNEHTGGENFADMFLGWTYGKWFGEYDVALADDRRDHMNTNMVSWLWLLFGN